jgi:hypothetical protein
VCSSLQGLPGLGCEHKKDANLHDCFQATSSKFARKLGCGIEAKGDSKDLKK